MNMTTRRKMLQPMTEAELAELVARTKDFGADGHIELCKTADFGCTWSRKNPA
ncbi:MAG: hypothetical protein IT577_08840 [Verrucomicrobiae bacterium]|nr:hypothetical protein [Verrucomicrobiae bacterium]